MKTKNMTTLPLTKSIGRSQLRVTFLLVSLVLACFVLSPRAQAGELPAALSSPTPDGGYPGHNTAEGHNALASRTTGVWDSAFGDSALFHDTIGTANTALGYNAMFNNLGAVTTPLMALLPSLAIPAVSATRPWVIVHSTKT
jgi:hypothetical protein